MLVHQSKVESFQVPARLCLQTLSRRLPTGPSSTNQLEVREKDEPTTPTTTSIHPFARRTKSRSFVEQKNLFSTTSTSTDSSSSDDPPKGDPDIWDESFDEILRTANRSIETAESILSTLRRGEENDVITPTKASTHDNQVRR